MNSFQNREYDTSDPELVAAIDDVPLWSAPFGQKILELVRMQKHTKVLDIGCGTGYPLLELAQRLGDTCTCFGVDPWVAALDRAKDKMFAWDIPNVDFYEVPAEELPFEEKLFDVIISNNGLNNVDDDIKSMAEIARVCKPNGQFILTFNLAETFIEFYTVFKNVLLQHNKKEELKKLDEHIHAKRKPIDYWRTLLEKNGFIVQRIFKDNFKFRYVDVTTMLNHSFIKLAFLPSWLDIVGKDAENIFYQIEKELNQHGELTLTVPWVAIEALKK